MEPSLFLPPWFFPIGILLEVFFAAAAFTFSYHAWRVYSFTDVKRMQLLSLAFLFFGLSYAVQAIINLFHISFFYTALLTGNHKVLLMHYAVYGFIIFQALGVVTLLYMVSGIRDKLFFIVLLAVTSLVIATQNTHLFALYILGGLLLVSTIVLYRYWQKRKTLHLLYGLFILLLAADKIGFFMQQAPMDGSLISHLILTASSLILATLLLILHHAKKE